MTEQHVPNQPPTLVIRRNIFDYLGLIVFIGMFGYSVPWHNLWNMEPIDYLNITGLVFSLTILIRNIILYKYVIIEDSTLKIYHRIFGKEIVNLEDAEKFYDNPYPVGYSYFLTKEGHKIGKIDSFGINKNTYAEFIELVKERGIQIF